MQRFRVFWNRVQGKLRQYSGEEEGRRYLRTKEKMRQMFPWRGKEGGTTKNYTTPNVESVLPLPLDGVFFCGDFRLRNAVHIYINAAVILNLNSDGSV